MTSFFSLLIFDFINEAEKCVTANDVTNNCEKTEKINDKNKSNGDAGEFYEWKPWHRIKFVNISYFCLFLRAFVGFLFNVSFCFAILLRYSIEKVVLIFRSFVESFFFKHQQFSNFFSASFSCVFGKKFNYIIFDLIAKRKNNEPFFPFLIFPRSVSKSISCARLLRVIYFASFALFCQNRRRQSK